MKALTKSISLVFKVVVHIVWNYSKKCFFSFDINTFWTLLNRETVVTVIKNLSKCKRSGSKMTVFFMSLSHTL